LSVAFEYGLIAWNPLTAVRSPPAPPRTPRHLTLEQAQALMDHVEESDDPRAFACQLMLRLGLRRGEALGLQWDDVDFETVLLTIQRSLRRSVRGDGDRREPLMCVAPKTVSGVRALRADSDLLDELAMRAPPHGTREREIGFVVRSRGNQPIDPDQMTAWLRGAGKELGFYVTPHRLRHTAATIMLNEGVPLDTVSAILGHADVRSSQFYARVIARTKGHALQTLADSLSRPPSRRRPSASTRRRSG
jgi:integrase